MRGSLCGATRGETGGNLCPDRGSFLPVRGEAAQRAVKPVSLSPLDHAAEFSAFASAAVLAALRRVQALNFSVGERR